VEPDDLKAEQQLLQEVEWAARWQWPPGPYMPVFRLARELGLPLVALNVADEALERVRRPRAAMDTRSTLHRTDRGARRKAHSRTGPRCTSTDLDSPAVTRVCDRTRSKAGPSES
jgi:hypothetical protein